MHLSLLQKKHRYIIIIIIIMQASIGELVCEMQKRIKTLWLFIIVPWCEDLWKTESQSFSSVHRRQWHEEACGCPGPIPGFRWTPKAISLTWMHRTIVSQHSFFLLLDDHI